MLSAYVSTHVIQGHAGVFFSFAPHFLLQNWYIACKSHRNNEHDTANDACASPSEIHNVSLNPRVFCSPPAAAAPLLHQLSAAGSRRGRSAGSSPVLPGMMAFSETSALPSAGGRGEGVVVRYRSSGDLSLMGREGSGGGGTARAKAGFAFSHDEAASHRQIEMIMRNR